MMRRTQPLLLLTAIAVLLLGYVLLTDESPESAATPSVQVDRPPPTPIPNAPSYMEIRNAWERMTEAQWRAYMNTLRGNKVTDWTGWIDNVDKKTLSARYALYIDIDDPDVFLSDYDVVIEIPQSEALDYDKDAHVRFSGIIDSISTLLGSLTVHVRDATVHIIE